MVSKIAILLISVLSFVSNIMQTGEMYLKLETILKFADYVSWPEETLERDLVIYIAENDEQKYEFAASYFRNTGFNGKKIQTEKLDNNTPINTADIIFIDEDANIDFAKLKEKILGKQIMTITTNKSLLKEGCMFYIHTAENQELEYLFNKQAVIESQMTIKSLVFTPKHKWNISEEY